MSTPRKFWFVWMGVILLMAAVIMACGTTTPTPAAPTALPSPTVAAPTAQPLPTVAAPTEQPASMAGNWDDPDTPGTVTTIGEQNGGYVVISVINPDRGVNELTWTKYENGVLSWEYCPQNMYCITSETVSVDDTTLVATWRWSDGGNGGTTYFNRIP